MARGGIDPYAEIERDEPERGMRRSQSCPALAFSFFAPRRRQRDKPLLVVDVRYLMMCRTDSFDDYMHMPNFQAIERLQHVAGTEKMVVFVSPEYCDYFTEGAAFRLSIDFYLKELGIDKIVSCESEARMNALVDVLCNEFNCTEDQVWAICADKSTQRYFSRIRTILPDYRLGELCETSSETVTACLALNRAPFVVGLDIDDTLLDLITSIRLKQVVFNPFVLQYIQSLCDQGYQFSVYFITARYNYDEHARLLSEHGYDTQGYSFYFANPVRTANVAEVFRTTFPGIKFLGTRHSRLVRLDGESSSAPMAKYWLLRQIARTHNMRVIYIENDRTEIKTVQEEDKDNQIACIPCHDTVRLSTEQTWQLAQEYAAVSRRCAASC